MSRHRHDLDLPLPIDEVFDVVTDPDLLPLWQPTIVGLHAVTDGGLDVGSRYRESRRFLGRDAEVVWTVAEHARPYRSAIEVATGPVRGHASYTLTETATGTHLVVEVDLAPQGVARLLAVGIAAAAEAELAFSLGRLQQLLGDRASALVAA